MEERGRRRAEEEDGGSEQRRRGFRLILTGVALMSAHSHM